MPAVAASPSSLYIVALVRARNSISARRGQVLDSSARPWLAVVHPTDGRPRVLTARSVHGYPRVGLDESGTLHALWAEADSVPIDARDFTDLRFTSVWHASYRNGEWTQPQQLYRARTIEWRPGGVSLRAAISGELHLVFLGDEMRAEGGTVMHMRWDGAVWRENKVKVRGLPVYTDVAADGRGRVAITYVAGYHDSTGSHVNTVFLTHSSDHGASWGPQRIVSNEPSDESKVLIDPDGAIRVVWMHRRPGDLSAERVWHARSADSGATWTDFASIPVPTRFVSRSQAVVDRCGTIHYVMDGRERGVPNHVMYSRFHGGRWTEWAQPQGTSDGGYASMVYDGQDRIFLAWHIYKLEQRGADSVVNYDAVRSELRLRR